VAGKKVIPSSASSSEVAAEQSHRKKVISRKLERGMGT
jgi:hypothetical protein